MHHHCIQSRTRGFLLAALAFILITSAGNAAELSVEPEMLTFEDLGQSFPVQLFLDGKPIETPKVKSWKLFTDSSSYGHMIDVTAKEGRLIISASETAEVGTYTLVIDTPDGAARVPVSITLSNTATTVEQQAKQAGIGAQVVERNSVIVELEPSYSQGSTLEIEIPRIDGRSCSWTVNGKVVSTDNRLSIPLDAPGPLEVVYEERMGETVTARAEGKTPVIPKSGDTVPFETRINTRSRFQSPPGYGNYTWFLDDVLISDQSVFEHTFKKAGGHRVRVHAESPSSAGIPQARDVYYDVTVKP